jgi:hypothetical protein
MPEKDNKKEIGNLIFSEIFIEGNEPNDDFGLDHDIYVKKTNSEVFKKINGSWQSKGFLGVTVNSDWEEDDVESKAYILNKPGIVSPEMLNAVEKELGIEIKDLNTLVNDTAVSRLNYDLNTNELSIIRLDDSVGGTINLPVGDGLKDGFIDKNTFIQVWQNKQDIDGLLSIDTDLFVIVQSLDSVSSPKENKIYLVPRENSKENDILLEYIWINNDWELIGNLNADIDPSSLVQSVDFGYGTITGLGKAPDETTAEQLSSQNPDVLVVYFED